MASEGGEVTLRAEVVKAGGQVRPFLLAEPSSAPSVIVLSLHGSGSSPNSTLLVGG